MVSKSQARRQRDIKSKLMAAIAMLLVSSIMMVSSTYAWFTLSTAPEVTGITTSVGANGNLEMALMPTDGISKTATQDFGITSGAGDSTKAINVRNLTWGNLVDLGSSDLAKATYGLDKITLYPSALNASTADANGNPTALATALLKTPTYGADGRVDKLLENTVTSTYDSANQNFPQNSNYGVRAVGTASGMTDRQLAYRNTRSAANTAMAQAKTFASQSLNTNGNALANIAISHAANSGTAADVYTKANVESLLAIVYDLLGVEGETTGVIEHIENAYRNYIVALGASKASAAMTDEQFKIFQGAVTSAATLTDAMNVLATYGFTIPASISTPVGELAKTKTNVSEAKTELEALLPRFSDTDDTNNSVAWSELSIPMSKLADTSAMQINGFAASTFRDNMSAIINKVSSEGLTVTIASNGGVYADVADHCGDYSASIVIERVEYNGLVLENMNAKMQTKTTVDTVYLSALSAAVETAGAPESAGGQVMPITDMFGYIIDLAFKTNAADSDLLLQVDGIDRIYTSEGEDGKTVNKGTEETMGHGSTMTFTSTTPDFTVDQLKALMGAVRIVFFDPTNNNAVLATAKLDMTEANLEITGGNTITAKMYIYTMGEATTTYEPVAEGQTATHKAVTTTTYEVATGAEATHIADDNAEGGYREATGDEVATHKAVTTTTYVEATGAEATHVEKVIPAGEQRSTDNKITALTQNTAKAVSVLVYLDGENMGNDDVAATAATSMTGTMNLQFASSANLVPMNYTPLMEQTGTNTPAQGGEGEG